jgi:intracellular septation protein
MNPQLRRSAIDFGPLLLFFAAYKLFGLFAATATVMIAAVAAAGLGYWFDRKLHTVPLVTAVVILVFGGLTLYLNDDIFIKMKPTMIYGLFGAVLLGGLIFNRSFVKLVFGPAMTLSDACWRTLSRRFGFFFLAMAILNELIWRNFSSDVWVNYHVFGAIALTVLFSMTQVPFLLKHQVVKDGD